MNPERIGPFVVLDANESTPTRRRRVLVRCTVCGNESSLWYRTFEHKEVLWQQKCAKCPNGYHSAGTWKKGVKHGRRD